MIIVRDNFRVDLGRETFANLRMVIERLLEKREEGFDKKIFQMFELNDYA